MKRDKIEFICVQSFHLSLRHKQVECDCFEKETTLLFKKNHIKSFHRLSSSISKYMSSLAVTFPRNVLVNRIPEPTMKLAILSLCLACVLVPTWSHLCLISPPQRGSMMGINKGGQFSASFLNFFKSKLNRACI